MESIKFSVLEKRIITELKGRKKGLMIKELALRVYKSNAPLNANNSVTATVAQINKKCAKFKCKWFIEGEGLGRNGKRVWLKTS